MKRIIIGTVVGAIIFFAYQSIMWAGGFHKDLWVYSAGQETVLQSMNDHHLSDGLHVIPYPDPALKKSDKEIRDEMMKNVGKPWAMVFYHSSMQGEDPAIIIHGFLHALMAVLIVVLVIYYGGFASFGRRFLASWGFGLFAIIQGPMSDLNWWGFPWSFIKPHVIDLSLGWAICCIWLAWYVKKSTAKAV